MAAPPAWARAAPVRPSKIAHFFAGHSEHGTVFSDDKSMKSSKDKLKDILISAETNCVLKIKFKNIRNPVITAVDHLAKNKIVLKPTCLYGYRLRKRNVTLLEIESVKRYKTQFDHPLFQKIRFIKKNIGELRRNQFNIQDPKFTIPASA